MKFARCECKNCGFEFMVTFSNSYPNHISCIKCSSFAVRTTWIDRAGFNKLIGE